MQPQIEVLESRLAAVLMGELARPHEPVEARDADDTYVDIILDDLDLDDSNDYYASYELDASDASDELVFEPAPSASASEAGPTIEFVKVRDTTHDHVITVRFAREAIDPDTLPVPKYSAPYELIDIQDTSHVFKPVPAETAIPGFVTLAAGSQPVTTIAADAIPEFVATAAGSQPAAIAEPIPEFVATADDELRALSDEISEELRAIPSTIADELRPLPQPAADEFRALSEELSEEFGAIPQPSAPVTTAADELSAYRQPVTTAADEFSAYRQPGDSTQAPLMFPLYSTPYERVDLQDRSHAFVRAEHEVVVRPSVEWFAAEPTDIITGVPQRSRWIPVVAILLCAMTALTIGLAIAMFAI